MDLSIYLVGYFDIMGQADSLRGLKAFAKTAEDDRVIANDVGVKAATILKDSD